MTSTKTTQLTPEQKTIIDANRGKFPADILQMPGMEGATARQITDYIKRTAADVSNPHKELADHIDRYILQYGLKQKYSKISEFVRYLRIKT